MSAFHPLRTLGGNERLQWSKEVHAVLPVSGWLSDRLIANGRHETCARRLRFWPIPSRLEQFCVLVTPIVAAAMESHKIIAVSLEAIGWRAVLGRGFPPGGTGPVDRIGRASSLVALMSAFHRSLP